MSARSGQGEIVTRFAPSPTGALHLGHAYSALFAARAGDRFLLRIEDIDRTRCRLEFETAIFEDLAWLGLRWEEPARRQSEHLAAYGEALARLRDDGLVYPCFCTRGDIAREIEAAGGAPHGPNGPVYPGICRDLDPTYAVERIAAGAKHALRLNMGKAIARAGPLRWRDRGAGIQEAAPACFGDVALARKDTPTSYHLSVTLDDALQGVGLVTRGVDLFGATDVHRLLQSLLDLPEPLYHHHKLITDETGRRLAKRDKAQTLAALRNSGVTPDEVRARLGFWRD